MRKFMIIYLMIGLIFIACQGQVQNSETETSKMEIKLNDLSDKHPGKLQMEFLINNYKEEFLECELDKDSLKKQSLIQKQYSFQTKNSNTSLILIFTKNQKNALSVAEANFALDSNAQKWGINGSTLFVVKGKDIIEVNSVLSHFAGEE